MQMSIMKCIFEKCVVIFLQLVTILVVICANCSAQLTPQSADTALLVVERQKSGRIG